MDRTCKIKGTVTAGVLWTLAVLLLVLFILLPLCFVFAKIRLSDLAGIFTAARFRKTILNTVIECVCSSVLSVFVGYVYAYAVVFGSFPFKKFFSSIPVLHLVTPPFVGGLAFILLLGRQGLITKTILKLDVSLYGFPGLLIAQTLCFFPLAYLMCRESLETLNRNLIDGAVSLGASRLKIFAKIILPLTFPSLVSSLLFIAVAVLSDFGNPMIVGGRFKVLAVEVYTQLTGWMNAGTSAALGLVLLLPSLALFFLQNKLFKKQVKKTAVLGGKGGTDKNDPEKNPVFRNSTPVNILLFVFVLFISGAVILQFVSIVAGSFQKLWGIDTSFTLDYIKKSFKYGKDFANTFGFALAASLLSALISAFVSFCIHRTESIRLPGKNFVDVLIQLPSAVPGSLMGLALSVTAGTLHFKAPGVMILAAMTIAFMPFSYRIVTSTFGQIKASLDEGARSLGVSPLKVFGKVLVPLSMGGIAGGWTYSFARGVGTLSSVIFLVSFNTPLCSVRILNLAEQGDWGRAAALAMELTVLTFVIILSGNLLSKKLQKTRKSVIKENPHE